MQPERPELVAVLLEKGLPHSICNQVGAVELEERDLGGLFQHVGHDGILELAGVTQDELLRVGDDGKYLFEIVFLEI